MYRSRAAAMVTPTPWRTVDKAVDNTSPLTPAVTGITFPSPTETRSDKVQVSRPVITTHAHASSLHHPSSSDDSVAPITPTDLDSLEQLWGNLRLEKERKMAEEPPKIKSLGESTLAMALTPKLLPDSQQALKKQTSLATFHESPDGQTMTAKFDIPGVKKQDVHVSFQRTRLVVTWETMSVTEREEKGRIVREKNEKIFSETIPLPDGTKFEEVRAAMDSRHLILKYPSLHYPRVESHRGTRRSS